MSLDSLLKVLFSHKVTIYKNTGCSGAQCHFEELYSGSQNDIPESLLVYPSIQMAVAFLIL